MKIFLILSVILVSNITCEKIKRLFKFSESGKYCGVCRFPSAKANFALIADTRRSSTPFGHNLILICQSLSERPVRANEALPAGTGPRDLTGKATMAIESRRARCILRYSPGACMQPASVVFTFDPLIRNCTERLGCLRTSRSNRFKSYVQCMNRCMSLLQPPTNISKIMPIDQEESARRDTDANVSLEPNMLESPIAALEEADTENDDEDIELIRHLYKSKTKDDKELIHVTPVDIDYIFGEFL